MADDWRILEVLKLLRQCIVCPFCGVLVATQEGWADHVSWHEQINSYTQNIDARFQQFADYITNPDTGLQVQIQNRLDTITNYVIAPGTGLEPRTFAAIQQLRDDATTAINQLRTDTTTAITQDRTRLTTIETEITRPNNGILARLATIEAQLGIVVPSS